eukprot:gene10307-8238_t
MKAFQFRLRATAPTSARFSTVVPRAATTDTPSASATPALKKVSLVSLGCPKNVVDGEVMLGDLRRNGFEITEEHEDADAVIINTCAFVEDAKTESLETIIEAAGMNVEGGKKKKIVITGCLAQRYSDQLANDLPEADLVVGFQNYGNLASSLRSTMNMPALENQKMLDPDGLIPSSSSTDRVQVGLAKQGGYGLARLGGHGVNEKTHNPGGLIPSSSSSDWVQVGLASPGGYGGSMVWQGRVDMEANEKT